MVNGTKASQPLCLYSLEIRREAMQCLRLQRDKGNDWGDEEESVKETVKK